MRYRLTKPGASIRGLSGSGKLWKEVECEMKQSGVGVGVGNRDKERYRPPPRRRLKIEHVSKDRSL